MRRFMKVSSLMMTGGFLFAAGSGGCLPDNLFVDTAGQVASGVIVSAINLFLAPTGLAVPT